MDSFTPTEFIAMVNQTLDYAYRPVMITGEVASFKVNQGKWVFFDLKDEESSVACFMPLWDLRTPLEDGMKVAIEGAPKVTKWGKFSVTVQTVKPVGEGSLKRAYEMLKKKLTKEGLFDPARKRGLPADLIELGVISSTQAAGYADFVKIINARWGGMKVTVAHTQVQGAGAPDQIMRALKYFNERGAVQVIAILRGGGSADDLACFNDEALVREIAASKIPVITGIGHEVDETLSDLAADVRASTPSNAAEMLTRDRAEERTKLKRSMRQVEQTMLQEIERVQSQQHEVMVGVTRELMHRVQLARERNDGQLKQILNLIKTKYIEPLKYANLDKMRQLSHKIQGKMQEMQNLLRQKQRLIEALNPEKVLKQGYAIIAGRLAPGEVVRITMAAKEAEAEIKKVKERS